MKRYTNKELQPMLLECQWCGARATDREIEYDGCGNDSTASRERPCWFHFVEAAADANDEIKALKRENKQLRKAVCP